MGQNSRSGSTERDVGNTAKKNLNGLFLTIRIHGSCSVSPQRSVSLNLDDVQGVEVGDEQVGLSVGCTGGENKHLERCQNKVAE